MTLPRPEDSHAVLIGTSQYAYPSFSEQQLPTVASNLAGLLDTLTDPRFGGFRRENCQVLHNDLNASSDPAQIQRALLEGARRASDTLLVYYAGHGVISRGKLYLTLPGTETDLLETTAFDYDLVRRTVLQNGQRQRLIVILDSCHAGLALPPPMDPQGLGLLQIEGTYVLTAAGPYETAWATSPAGSPYTAFTGALLEQLRTGDPDLPETLTLNGLFPRLEAAISRITDQHGNHPPSPLRVNHQTAGDLALTRNRTPGGGRALVLDLREGGVVAATRLTGNGISPVSLSRGRAPVTIAVALQTARGPAGLPLHDRVTLVVPADWDDGRRRNAIRLAGEGGAHEPVAVLRPVAAARYAIGQMNIEVDDGRALLVHEQGPSGVAVTVLVRTGSRWKITDTVRQAGPHSPIDGRRLTNRTLIGSDASRLVVGMLMLTPDLGPEQEKELENELGSLDLPVYPVVNAWEALTSGALSEPGARSEPGTDSGAGPGRLTGPTSRPELVTAVLAGGLGIVGFAVLQLVTSVGFWPATGVAVTAAAGTYLSSWIGRDRG